MERSSALLRAVTRDTEGTGTCAVCMIQVLEGAKLPCSHTMCVECCNGLFASGEKQCQGAAGSEPVSAECVCTSSSKCCTPSFPYCRAVFCAQAVNWNFLHCVDICPNNKSTQRVASAVNAEGSANATATSERHVEGNDIEDDEIVFLGMTRGNRRLRRSTGVTTRASARTACNTRNRILR